MDWAVRVFRLMRNDLGENWVGPDLSRIRTELDENYVGGTRFELDDD